MSNIFQYDLKITACNKAFATVLDSKAQNGGSFNLSDLVLRYTFDLLFATTVGANCRFLNNKSDLKKSDLKKINDAIISWKASSITSG